jgi:hypothetical protein
MMFLAATTDKLQLITSAAATVDVNVNYVDAVKTTGATSDLNRQNTAITTATTTDILAAPGASTTRNAKQLTVRNKDASLACDVTVVFNQNGTSFELHKVSLGTGDTLEYIEGVGFFTLTPSAKLNTMVCVKADSVHATAATFADIAGLTVPLLIGKDYIFEAHLFHISNATTTGAQFGVNIGAVPTTLIVGNISGVTNSVTAGAISLGTATARDTAITAQTTGSAGITHTIISGCITPSANGIFAMRATSEVTVASGLTVKKGSWLAVRQTDN